MKENSLFLVSLLTNTSNCELYKTRKDSFDNIRGVLFKLYAGTHSQSSSHVWTFWSSYFDMELVPGCKSMHCFLLAMKNRLSKVIKFTDSITFMN